MRVKSGRILEPWGATAFSYRLLCAGRLARGGYKGSRSDSLKMGYIRKMKISFLNTRVYHKFLYSHYLIWRLRHWCESLENVDVFSTLCCSYWLIKLSETIFLSEQTPYSYSETLFNKCNKYPPNARALTYIFLSSSKILYSWYTLTLFA